MESRTNWFIDIAFWGSGSLVIVVFLGAILSLGSEISSRKTSPFPAQVSLSCLASVPMQMNVLNCFIVKPFQSWGETVFATDTTSLGIRRSVGIEDVSFNIPDPYFAEHGSVFWLSAARFPAAYYFVH